MTSTDNSPPISNLPAVELKPVEQVIAWLLDGQRDSDIRAAIESAWPDADAKQLQIEAVAHFERAAKFDIDVVHGWALEAYRDLYRRMVAIGDFAAAIRAVKELVALANHVHQQHQEEIDEEAEAERPQAAAIASKPPAKQRRRPKKPPASGGA